jgi:outer membrane autotransporter protein
MGSLGYTLNRYEMDRNVSFGDLSRTASRSVDGGVFNTALETGYDFKFTNAILNPAATLFYSRARVDGFTENGADALNLSVDAQTAESLQGGIGLRAARPFRTYGTDAMVQVSAFYQHEFSNNSRGLNARLVQTGSGFTIQTDPPHRDFVVLGGGLAFNISRHFSLQANYNVELGGSEYTAHLVSAGIKWKF